MPGTSYHGNLSRLHSYERVRPVGYQCSKEKDTALAKVRIHQESLWRCASSYCSSQGSADQHCLPPTSWTLFLASILQAQSPQLAPQAPQQNLRFQRAARKRNIKLWAARCRRPGISFAREGRFGLEGLLLRPGRCYIEIYDSAFAVEDDTAP